MKSDWRLPRALVSTLLSLLVVACGASTRPGTASSPTHQPSHTSGITGHTVLGPTCPVERVNGPPCSLVISAEVTITDSSGKVVADVTSSANGIFRVGLMPGQYTVAGVRTQKGPGMFTKPSSIFITPDRFVPVTVIFDTGIR